MKKLVALVLATLLALSTLAFGIALAEEEHTLEDFLGTWKVETVFLLDAETGDLLGEYPADQVEVDDLRIVIEPDRVAIVDSDSVEILTDVSVQKNERGTYYLSACSAAGDTLALNLDDSNSYFDHTVLNWINSTNHIHLQRTDEVVEIPETTTSESSAAKPEETVAEETVDEAADLFYTPGEDLLLVDQDGVKVWLTKNRDFGAFNEEWNAYTWYTLKFENDTDADIMPVVSWSVDNHSMEYHAHWLGASLAPHSSSEQEFTFFGDWFSGSEEEMLSAVYNPRTLDLDIEFAPLDESINDYNTDAPLFTAHVDTIHFDDAEGAARLSKLLSGEEMTLEDYAGVWKLLKVFDIEDAASLPLEKIGINPDDYTITITSDYVTSDALGIKGNASLDGNTIAVTLDNGNTFVMTIGNDSWHEYKNALWIPNGGNSYAIFEFAGKPEDAPETELAAAEKDETDAAVSAGPGEEHVDKETVKAAQQALNDAGYECGTPDGVAGKKTKKAISDYQTDKGLTVTGTVTDETLISLGLMQAPQQAEDVPEPTEETVPEVEPSQDESETTSEETAAEADDASAEQTVVPQELVNLTGGLPDSLDALSDRYDFDTLRTLGDAWDSVDMIRNLRESGAYDLPDLGLEWKMGKFIVEVVERSDEYNDKQYRDFELAFDNPKGATTVSLKSKYQLDAQDNFYGVYLDAVEGYRLLTYYYYDAETDAYEPFMVNTLTLSDETFDIGDYTNVSVLLRYQAVENTFFISISGTSKGIGWVTWSGEYSAETGQALNRTYSDEAGENVEF